MARKVLAVKSGKRRRSPPLEQILSTLRAGGGAATVQSVPYPACPEEMLFTGAYSAKSSAHLSDQEMAQRLVAVMVNGWIGPFQIHAQSVRKIESIARGGLGGAVDSVSVQWLREVYKKLDGFVLTWLKTARGGLGRT